MTTVVLLVCHCRIFVDAHCCRCSGLRGIDVVETVFISPHIGFPPLRFAPRQGGGELKLSPPTLFIPSESHLRSGCTAVLPTNVAMVRRHVYVPMELVTILSAACWCPVSSWGVSWGAGSGSPSWAKGNKIAASSGAHRKCNIIFALCISIAMIQQYLYSVLAVSRHKGYQLNDRHGGAIVSSGR